MFQCQFPSRGNLFARRFLALKPVFGENLNTEKEINRPKDLPIRRGFFPKPVFWQKPKLRQSKSPQQILRRRCLVLKPVFWPKPKLSQINKSPKIYSAWKV